MSKVSNYRENRMNLKEYKDKIGYLKNRKLKDWLRQQGSLKHKEWACKCSRILALVVK